MMNDDNLFEENFNMGDVEKVGEGLEAGGALIGALGAVVLGIIGLIKLFTKDES